MNRYASFAQAAFERAVKAFAWSLSSLLIAEETDILSTDWGSALSVAGMAGVLSVLGSLASAKIGGTGPSLANEVIVPPGVDPQGDRGYSAVELVVGVLLVLILAVVLLRLL